MTRSVSPQSAASISAKSVVGQKETSPPLLGTPSTNDSFLHTVVDYVARRNRVPVMTETLYVGGATGYDQMFARVTQAFIPALLDAARIPRAKAS